MKNIELLNTCYKFFNRFITVNQLINDLSNINKDNLNDDDINEINNIVNDIKKISNDNPNKEDDYIRNTKEKIKGLIDKLSNVKEDNEMLNKHLEDLKKDYEKEMDCHERWYKVTAYLDNNKYFNNCFDSLSDTELLEFITQYIHAPFPPNIGQEKFDSLVSIGIQKDEREWLWRLAFNYEGKYTNFERIAKHYIEKKDGYYLSELISAVGECIDIDKITDEINDKDLIEDLLKRKKVIENYVTIEQFNKLESKLNN